MAWLNDQQSATTSQDNIWLTFPKLQNPGDDAEVRIRILEDEPAGVWQHWLDGRPYNCCRPDNDCPVCQARAVAKETSPDGYRDDFPMRFRYFFNVLTEESGKPVVKAFGFSTGLGKNLKAFSQKYGSLNAADEKGYDVTVRKTQTGRLPMNVEYSIFYEGRRALTTEELTAAQSPHDLTQFTKPASVDVLRSVAQGKAPTDTENEEAKLLTSIRSIIPSDMDLSHFDISDSTPRAKLEATLRALRGE